MLARVQDYTTDQFAATMADIRENYQRRPTGGAIRLADSPDPMTGGDRMSKEQMDKALRYSAEHPGTAFWDAVEKTGGKRPDYVTRGA